MGKQLNNNNHVAERSYLLGEMHIHAQDGTMTFV